MSKLFDEVWASRYLFSNSIIYRCKIVMFWVKGYSLSQFTLTFIGL